MIANWCAGACCVSVRSPVLALPILAVLSAEAVSTDEPSGENTADHT